MPETPMNEVEATPEVATGPEELGLMVDQYIEEKIAALEGTGITPQMLGLRLKALIEARGNAVTVLEDGSFGVDWDDLPGDALNDCLHVVVLKAARVCAQYLLGNLEVKIEDAKIAAEIIEAHAINIRNLAEARRQALVEKYGIPDQVALEEAEMPSTLDRNTITSE